MIVGKFKKKTIYTGGQVMMDLPFMGENMTCGVCGKRQKSNAKRESGWTSVTVDNVRTYVCPVCWDMGVKAVQESPD